MGTCNHNYKSTSNLLRELRDSSNLEYKYPEAYCSHESAGG